MHVPYLPPRTQHATHAHTVAQMDRTGGRLRLLTRTHADMHTHTHVLAQIDHTEGQLYYPVGPPYIFHNQDFTKGRITSHITKNH